MNVCIVNLSNYLEESLYKEFQSCISKEKREKLKQFRDNNDILKSLIGDIIVRSIICKNIGIKNKQIEFTYNKYGKPTINNYNKLHFNITHSGNRVAAIVDDYPIGIDIEKISPLDHVKIAKKCFTKDEYIWLYSQEENEILQCFYKLWTLKECYVKKVGKGLIVPFNSFSFNMNYDNNISSLGIRDTEKVVYFKSKFIETDYVMSICMEKQVSNINVIEKSFEELLVDLN